MEWQDRRLRMNFKPGIKILGDFKFRKPGSQIEDLGISFPMVFESPQSELRFESYGRNKKMKFGSDPPPNGDGPLPTSTE